MNSRPILWRNGDPKLCAQIERAYAGVSEGSEPIQTSVRRTLHLLSLERLAADPTAQAHAPGPTPQSGMRVVLKVYHRRRGLRALRDFAKRILGRSAARREWAALEQTTLRGLPVPEPLAYGRLADGDEILAMRFVPGRSLLDTLPDPDPETWKRTCDALADAIQDFHGAGLRHGDLHAGNLRLGAAGIVLLDLQRTRRSRGQADRMADLARLLFSLRRSGASEEMCLALRRTLGVGAELDHAILEFTRDYQRGRARRRLRAGREWERTRLDPHTKGLTTQGLELARLVESFSSTASGGGDLAEIRRTDRVRICEKTVLGHRIVAKKVSAGGFSRAIADRFRGSAGARAFRRGQADRLISDRTAPALAYVDLFRFGLPVESWLFMDRVGDEDLDSFVPKSPAEARQVARALGQWLAENHANGLSHQDLKGGNIRIRRTGESTRFWLVDLQDLTGPGLVPESARIEALCQLNASLADAAFDRSSRISALEAYAERVAFSRPLEAVAAEITRRSLARRHRFRAEGCAAARGEDDSRGAERASVEGG